MNRQLILMMLSLFIGLPGLLANHNRAGEILYTQIGERTIMATVITYTKASSVQSDRDSLNFCWGDGVCEKIGRSNGEGFPPQGEVLSSDFKRNIYQATHTYEELGTYTLYMRDPNRNGGILNLNFPNSENIPFHIESTLSLLDISLGQANNSAVPLVPPLNLAYVGQPFIHVLNAIDIDGDSITYELVTPQQNIKQNIS